ncbi:hypothetical protein ACEU6E_02560 [Halorutilales archaeon Cl-col2-1]
MAPEPKTNMNGCPTCGEDLRTRHCKILCPNCGVVADCSDPFYL